jgi:DNA-binding response OmpR family regulator
LVASYDRRLKVLIVEDVVDCAESTATYLRLLDHTVEIALDGHIALEKAEIFKPEVVLLDIGLPKLNGFEVAKRLSANRPHFTPLIIAYSGFGPEVFTKEKMKCGIDIHLVKPFALEKLQFILNRFKSTLDGVEEDSLTLDWDAASRQAFPPNEQD